MKSTIDILRHARSTYDRTAAVDRLLELGYSPERAARACSLYPQGETVSLDDLIGKTLVSITERVSRRVDDEIVFVATTGEKWRMWYQPDCCATAWIEDINGDLKDLVNSPIVMAEAVFDVKTPPVDKCVRATRGPSTSWLRRRAT